MLDVHVLTLPSTRPDWQRQCLESVHAAAALAGDAVKVHVIPGVPGNLGKARADGYAAGTAPWKCYADDDDVVLPHAFTTLLRYLDRDVAAIFPREYVEQNGRRHAKTLQRHHLWPVRADLAAQFDHAAWPSMPDEMLRRAAAADPRGVLDLEEVVYVHRIYSGQRCRSLRREHRDEVLRVMREAPPVIKPPPLPGSDAASGWYAVRVDGVWRVGRDYWINAGGGTYPEYRRGPDSRYIDYGDHAAAHAAAERYNGGAE